MAKQPIPLQWSTVQRKVNDLVPMTNNPRTITERGRMKLIESLKRFNLVDLPVIDHDGTTVSGHRRLEALQAIGRGDEIIDVRMPNRPLTDKERREYNLLANSHAGAFDFEELEAFTEGLDLEGLGLDFSFADFGNAEETAEGNPSTPHGDDTLPQLNNALRSEAKDPFDDSGITAVNKYGVIIMCDDDDAQRRVFEEMTGAGYKCKILVV
jgi:hypothetical protein